MAKSLTSRLEDAPRRFRAHAPVKGQEAMRRIYATVDSIGALFEYAEGISCIEMKNGVVIPVALDVDALNQKIYDTNDDVVDLYAVTGDAVTQVAATVFRTSFNHAVQEDTRDGLSIVAYMHADYDANKFQRVTFSFEDVQSLQAAGPTKAPMTLVHMDSGKQVAGYRAFYVDMSLDVFTARVDTAKQRGDSELDLCAFTRPQKNNGKDMFSPT
jgi:hypothetical protein